MVVITIYGFIYYYLAAICETLFFRQRRPTRDPSQSTMDPTKLAKLQAQAASNRIGTFDTHPAVVSRFASVCVWGLADDQAARGVRREGHSAAKDCAQIETFEHPGRQEAPGCAQEAERAADRGRGGGEHVQGGRERVALQRSQR
jgi:hypothetical protein